jgi:cell division protein FtsB
MNPGEAFTLIAVISICAGTLVSLTALLLKHRQRMAGLGGKTDTLRQTVALLTETLERQHDRQQRIVARLDALEAEREAPEEMSRLALPSDDAPESLASPAQTRIRA